MKPGTIILIIFGFIAVAAASFFIGRRLPNSDLQKERAEMKALALSQNETIGRMELTIQSQDTAIRAFVLSFDQFRSDNKLELERMERHASKGREFQANQIQKLADLNRRRDALAEEAKMFDY